MVKKLKIDKSKLRKLTPSKNYFLSLVRAIIYQQISTAAGTSIFNKFLKLFGNKKPTPKLLLTFSDKRLRGAGLSPQKLSYMKDLAKKFEDKTINPKNFHQMPDEEIREHLVRVKGIGIWTADMFLISALNRPNVLPLGDLGIRKGFQKAFKLRNLPSETHMKRLAKAHEGEYTQLSLHLWGILD